MFWFVILFVAVFLVYPYVLDDLTTRLVARNDRKKASRRFARISAYIACGIVALYMLTFGLEGKNVPFIIVASVLFVFCVETTGGLIGAVYGPPSTSLSQPPTDRFPPQATALEIDNDNPYRSPSAPIAND
jgi:hypothetical protein